MESLVSIIIPAYNAYLHIDNCIHSVVNQTYTNLEIIIINDGSTDKTLDLLNKWSVLDKRIKVLNQENSGVSNSRNRGIKISTGDYLAFVDSDDTISKYYIEFLIKSKLENSCDLSICRISNSYKKSISFDETLTENQIYSQKEIFDNFGKLLSEGNLNSVCCKLYSKNLISKNEIYMNPALDMGEDLCFNLDYLNYVDKVCFIPNKLYHYNCDNSFLTKKYRLNLFDQRIESTKHFEKFINKNNIKFDVGNLYIKLFFAEVMSNLEVEKSHMNYSKRKKRIDTLLKKDEIQKHINDKTNLFQYRVLRYVARSKSAFLIEIFSRVLIVIKKFMPNYKRVSV